MPAPVSIVQTHVHSLRLRNGVEALVARVVTTAGVVGYGFSLGPEATPARDMAAWDALARSRKVPLYALFGEKTRERVAIARNTPDDVMTVDPFELLSIEAVVAEVRTRQQVFLVAAHAHRWELFYCAALAAALPGEILIAAILETDLQQLVVSDSPGIGIDWSLEPAFDRIAWYDARVNSPQGT